MHIIITKKNILKILHLTSRSILWMLNEDIFYSYHHLCIFTYTDFPYFINNVLRRVKTTPVNQTLLFSLFSFFFFTWWLIYSRSQKEKILLSISLLHQTKDIHISLLIWTGIIKLLSALYHPADSLCLKNFEHTARLLAVAGRCRSFPFTLPHPTAYYLIPAKQLMN